MAASNYDLQVDIARDIFLRYDQLSLIRKFGLDSDDAWIYLTYLNVPCRISRADGRIEEFRSVLFYFPEDKTGISFITNQSDYDVNQISINMLRTAMNMDFEMPDFIVKTVDLSILKTYEGTYKAPNFPLAIRIFVENNKLMAQATGQGAFAFEVVSDTEFQFMQAGIKIKFNPGKNTFNFKQGATELVFTKQ